MSNTKVKRNVFSLNFNELEKEYLPDELNDSDEIYNLKLKLKQLDEVSRRILILYSDTGSLKECSKILNVSVSSLRNYLKDIKNRNRDLWYT